MNVFPSKLGLAFSACIGFAGIANAQSVFTVYKTGTIHHHASGKASGYDLVNDAALMVSEPDSLKDFMNADAAGGYTGMWKAGNATTFVNAPGWPTFNAQTGSVDFTYAKVDSLFKAGPVITKQDKAGSGSKYVYIAKIRGTDTYVIFKFLSYIGGSSSIEGSQSFEYWKMPAAGSVGIHAASRAKTDANTIRPLHGRFAFGNGILNALGRPVAAKVPGRDVSILPLR